jgi:hypothetical protein
MTAGEGTREGDGVVVSKSRKQKKMSQQFITLHFATFTMSLTKTFFTTFLYSDFILFSIHFIRFLWLHLLNLFLFFYDSVTYLRSISIFIHLRLMAHAIKAILLPLSR